MSIKLLSPGTDDVSWLSLDVPTLIVEGRDGGFPYACFCSCFVYIFGGISSSSSSLWIRSLGSVVTGCMPFMKSLLCFLELRLKAVMPAAVSCVIDAMAVFVLVLACCWKKNFPIVRQILNTKNSCLWDSLFATIWISCQAPSWLVGSTHSCRVFEFWIHTTPPFIFYIHRKCTKRTCTIWMHAFPKFYAGVQWICALSSLDSSFSPHLSSSKPFLQNVVLKGTPALLSKPLLPEVQQETIFQSSSIYTAYW